MLYGFKNKIDNKIATVVVCGDDFDNYFDEVQNMGNYEFFPMMEKIMKPEYSELPNETTVVFYHNNNNERNEFISFNNIQIEPLDELIERYSEMVENETTNKKTLSEIYGLDKNDPWDKRTPEEIEQDEKKKKTQEGEMATNDSPKTSQNDDGSFSASLPATNNKNETKKVFNDEENPYRGKMSEDRTVICGSTEGSDNSSYNDVFSMDDFKAYLRGDSTTCVLPNYYNNRSYKDDNVPEEIANMKLDELRANFYEVEIPEQILECDNVKTHIKKIVKWGNTFLDGWVHEVNDVLFVRSKDDVVKIKTKAQHIIKNIEQSS